MTITETPFSTTATDRLVPVSFDVYRDIHKGIRSELFAVVVEAGRLDPADDLGAVALADQVQRTVQLLLDHAEHEDGPILASLEVHAPELAERIVGEHHEIDARMLQLVDLANAARDGRDRRFPLHELYLELAAFTAAYLQHQDVEERIVAQALDAAVGFEGLLAIHGATVGAIPPQELVSSLALMLPVMNVDDRTEMLGGMQATAPAEVFEGVWSLAKSVLTTDEHRAVGTRLGLS
jgi:hypothetical protein